MPGVSVVIRHYTYDGTSAACGTRPSPDDNPVQDCPECLVIRSIDRVMRFGMGPARAIVQSARAPRSSAQGNVPVLRRLS